MKKGDLLIYRGPTSKALWEDCFVYPDSVYKVGVHLSYFLVLWGHIYPSNRNVATSISIFYSSFANTDIYTGHRRPDDWEYYYSCEFSILGEDI
jgi:hypothetical protein